MQRSTPHAGRHMWIMLLCCLIPLAALAAIFVFKVPVSQALRYGLILLCPLGHIVMMALMGRGHSHGQPDQSLQCAALNPGPDRPTNG